MATFVSFFHAVPLHPLFGLAAFLQAHPCGARLTCMVGRELQKPPRCMWLESRTQVPSLLPVAVPLHPAVHVPVCVLHGVWAQEEAGKARQPLSTLPSERQRCPGYLEAKIKTKLSVFKLYFSSRHLQNKSHPQKLAFCVITAPECPQCAGNLAGRSGPSERPVPCCGRRSACPALCVSVLAVNSLLPAPL